MAQFTAIQLYFYQGANAPVERVIQPKHRYGAGMKASLNQKGFSLIEVLVVCVIVAILAAVSIPLYMGYINNQRATTVNNLAETAAAAANTQWRRTGVALTDGNITPNTAPLNLYFNATNYTVAVSGVNIVVTDNAKTSINKSVAYR